MKILIFFLDDANNQLVPLHNINGLEHTYSLKNILGVGMYLKSRQFTIVM